MRISPFYQDVQRHSLFNTLAVCWRQKCQLECDEFEGCVNQLEWIGILFAAAAAASFLAFSWLLLFAFSIPFWLLVCSTFFQIITFLLLSFSFLLVCFLVSHPILWSFIVHNKIIIIIMNRNHMVLGTSWGTWWEPDGNNLGTQKKSTKKPLSSLPPSPFKRKKLEPGSEYGILMCGLVLMLVFKKNCKSSCFLILGLS